MAKDVIEDIFGVDEKVDQTKSDVKQDSVKDVVQIDNQGNNPEIEKLKQQIEKLTKQESDTKKWGNENREVYMRAKKKTEELAKKLFDEGTLFDEDYEVLKNVFEKDLNIDTPKDEEVIDTPIKKVVGDLRKTFDEYKKWSDESDLDYKYNAFFKDLELITDKRFKEIQEYLLSETDPKVLLKYVLDRGAKSYDKFYKKVLEKGDALSYVEDLLAKNEKLEKEIKELRSELDDTEEKVYNKSTNRSSISYKSKDNSIVNDLF